MKHVQLKHGIARVSKNIKPETSEALDEMMEAAETQIIVMPRRIWRKRTKGFVLAEHSTNPNGVVCVSRPGKYGNPFRVGNVNLGGTIDGVPINQTSWDFVLIAFRRWAEKYLTDLAPLRGKDLACWCAVWQCDRGHRFGEEIPYSRVIKYCPKCGSMLTRVPCHADILLELANE